MDLLKARERARKKAQEQKQENAEEDGAPSSAERSAQAPKEQEAARSVPPSTQETTEEPEAASAADSVSEGPEDKPPPEDRGKSEDSAFVSMSDFSEEDVFSDDSFGEELPSFPEQEGGSQDVSEDSMVLDGVEVEGGEEKTAQKKDKKKEDKEPLERSAPGEQNKPRSSGEQAAASGETGAGPSMEWEVREHMTPEKQKQEPAEASPPPEEEPPEDEPSPEGEYSLEDMATEEDDFFSLVTEDLYMREFGAEGAEAEDQFSLLSFRLANETYAVRLVSIRQIIKLVPITMVPRVPDYVLGIISLRGTVIPVFDLRRILKLPEAEATRKSRIIIVNHAKYTAGLLVDQVEQVVRMSESAIEPPPPVLGGVEAEYIKGIGRVDSKMVIFLALEKIMVPVG